MNEYLIMIMLKIFFINLFIYWVTIKITNTKKINYSVIVIASIIGAIIYGILNSYAEHVFIIILLYLIQTIFLRLIITEDKTSLIICNLISNAITYMGFIVASILEVIPKIIFGIDDMIINLFIILILEIFLLIGFFKLKRFNKGFSFLKKRENEEYSDIIMTNISSVIIFAYCLFGSYYGDLTTNLVITFIILTIIMLIMIQKTLTLYYKQRLMNKTIENYKNDITAKDAQIQKLSAEKYKISKLNHEFYNRQKSLERKVKEIVTKANLNMETASELGVMDQISSLTKEYSAKLEEIKKLDELPSTDIEEIDDMFKYMQSECKENNIDFKLKINGNIHHLVNTIIPQNKLVTLIGDHLRDAIIAVDSSSNSYRSIIAILGVKDNTYEFCVYDTGIEFEIATLLKLGLEPATTHKETGGTGIGFMTTFETLKETNASLIIEEKHEMTDNDYTKAVIIRFDGKNEYKIRSYRSKQIGKSDRIIIEKI